MNKLILAIGLLVIGLPSAGALTSWSADAFGLINIFPNLVSIRLGLTLCLVVAAGFYFYRQSGLTTLTVAACACCLVFIDASLLLNLEGQIQPAPWWQLTTLQAAAIILLTVALGLVTLFLVSSQSSSSASLEWRLALGIFSVVTLAGLDISSLALSFPVGTSIDANRIAHVLPAFVSLGVGVCLLYAWYQNMPGRFLGLIMVSVLLLFCSQLYAVSGINRPFDYFHLVSELFKTAAIFPALAGILYSLATASRASVDLQSADKVLDWSEQVGVGLWEWRREASEIQVNQRWADMAGYQLKDILPLDTEAWSRLFHPEDTEALKKAAMENELFACEARMKTSADEWLWVLVSGRVLARNDEGLPAHIQGCQIEISTQKAREDELKLAKEAAEAGLVAKAKFLSNISDEIKTPLNGVLGMLALLGKSSLASEQAKQVAIANDTAAELMRLIDDMLDYSRIETGRLKLDSLDFNLRQLTNELVQSRASIAERKQLELILDLTNLHDEVLIGDPTRVRQVLAYLLDNALKFTAAGEVLVELSTQRLTHGGIKLEGRVQDSGVGIAEQDHEKLFGSFSLIGGATTRSHVGTGLGLAMVRRLCRLLGGDIKVVSKQGVGSSFNFWISLSSGSLPSTRIPGLDLRGEQVLVVEPNHTVRRVLVAQLEHWGGETMQAANGKEALICLEKADLEGRHLPTVAIIDAHMEPLKGEVLGRILRSDNRFNTMSLILMTSRGAQGDARHYAELGFDAYFTKPANPSDLHDALSIVKTGGTLQERANPLITRHYLRELGREIEDVDMLLAPFRVLLVEDNLINQEVALGFLEDLGLELHVADNGLQALAMLIGPPDKKPFHLVLMDCHMPELDGYETTRQIRAGAAGEFNKMIPVVAMTANASIADRALCAEAGMNDFLSKPLNPEELRRVLVGRLMQSAESEAITVDPVEDLVWDVTSALQRVRGKPERLCHLLGLFIEDMPEQIANLRTAIGREELDSASEIAHLITGVAANLSGTTLMETANLLKLACDLKRQEDARELQQSVEVQYEMLESRLRRYQREHGVLVQ